MRVQVLLPCLRTEPGTENTIGAHSARDQLIAVRTGEIELQPVVAALREPSFNRALVGASLAKSVGHFGSDFPAALPQTRSDGGDEILWTAAERVGHRLDAFRRRARRCPAPSCVHGPGGAASIVQHQNRRAIGDTNANGDGRIVGNDDVCFGTAPRHDDGAPGNRGVRPVYLAHEEQAIQIDAEKRRHIPPFALVVLKPQIAGGIQMRRAHRRACEHAAPRRLRPRKRAVRLRNGHERHRIGIRRDRHSAHS